MRRTAAGVLALRFVPVLALGLAAVFLVAVVAFLGPGLAFVVAVFFGAAVLVVVLGLVAVLVLVAAAFCRLQMLACETLQYQLPGYTFAAAGFLTAGAAAASFFASFTVPEVPE